MKKVLLSLITGLGMINGALHAQCSISNSGFETWERDSVESILGDEKSYYERPKDWQPLLSMLVGAFTGVKPGIYKSTDAKAGAYALELRADPLTADTVQSGGDLFTILPCNSNPAQLKGYVYTQGFDSNDSAMIGVAILNAQQDTVGEGGVVLTASNGVWTEFSFPIDYTKKEGAVANIIVLYMPEDVTKLKSVKIDGLAFSSLSAVDDALVQNRLAVYPNPFKDQITLPNVTAGELVKIYDMLGNEIKSLLTESNNPTISLADLENGMYVVEHIQSGVVARAKVVKN